MLLVSSYGTISDLSSYLPLNVRMQVQMHFMFVLAWINIEIKQVFHLNHPLSAI